MTARILIAGTVGSASRILAERLRQAYFAVSLQPDTAAAMTRLRDWQPDVLVLECAPDDAGLAQLRRLRGDPAARHTPILLLSATTDPTWRLHGLDLGAEDVLSVPLDMELLAARLQAMLRTQRLRDQWRIRREDLPSLALVADAAPPSTVAGARALVVDDDDSSVAVVRAGLDRDRVASGCAATATQAATLCAAMAFDLIVLNLALLTGDPLRVVAEIRAADATRHVPLLLLATPELRLPLLQGLGLGADDWLAWSAGDASQSVPELRARARSRLRQKFRQDRLRADLAHAFEMALIDPLTGCDNRRHLGRKLQAMLASAPAHGVAVLLVDIDRFKAVNERLGYAAADRALVQLADLLRNAAREMDSVGRLGGEEFVVLMPGCTATEATQTAERICRIVRAGLALEAAHDTLDMTVSIGVAAYDGDSGAPPVTPDKLLHDAKQALEAARRQGDRVSVAPVQEPVAFA